MVFFKKLSITFILFLSVFPSGYLTLHAQVTIGSGVAPQRGALLDLKENEDADHNSTKGVLYPRVKLSKRDELYPMYGDANNPDTEYTANKATLKKAYTGLVVYNLTSNDSQTAVMDIFQTGIFYWDGEQWRLIDNSLMLKPSIDDLKCQGATLTPNTYTQGVPYKGILKVPYTGGNGAPYLPVAIAPVNGLEAMLQPGKLAVGAGELYFDVTGTPRISSPDQTSFPISFADISCMASVGDGRDIKVMEYAKLYISPLPTAPEPAILQNAKIAFSQPVTMGNIKVRYFQMRYWGALPMTEEYIQFAPAESATNVTYSYTKHGSGGVNYAVYGQALLKANQFITPNGKEWDPAGTGFIQVGNHIKDNSADAYTLNSGNRDFAILTVVFHNTGEIYRINFNINGFIPGEGITQNIESALTIFVEKLE